MCKRILTMCLLFICVQALPQDNASVSFEQWLSLKNVGAPSISPDGKNVLYQVTSTDWADNTYDSEIWLSMNGDAPFQLTRTTKGSSTSATFTPDGRFISFIAERGNKSQLYIIPVQGGEALAVTGDEDGVAGYEWSPDGKQLVYTKADPDSKKDKAMRERYGSFMVQGNDYKLSHLWLLSFNYDSVLLAGQLPCYTSTDSLKKTKAEPCYTLPKAKRLTDGAFTVTSFAWRPDGKSIIMNVQPDPLINSSVHSDIAIVYTADKKIEKVVSNPSSDFFDEWSPDGQSFVYNSSLTDSLADYYVNNRLFIYDMATKKSVEVATDIDENKSVAGWKEKGIYILASKKMSSGLYLLDPMSGKSKEQSIPVDVIGGFNFAKNSNSIVATGRKFDGMNEVFAGAVDGSWKQLTSMTSQVGKWNTPLNDIITWKSKDGANIEGILLKPRNFDPTKKYPLLVVIHGGPTGVDRPEPTPTYVYPIMQWVEKGAVVLRVNYRGSAGYGAKFRALNVRNLGVGDMWDVVSGIESLNKRGFIDKSRMGCMGWSQGGYISAFLTTNTTMFKAISVGAGISNWVTYYVNTDITPFTREYLKATPWSDQAIYSKTSPMTNINKARTPTLIQHGELDKRVPIPNAFELYRGLQDRGIPSKFVIYKGFGHGITKPKERLAAIWHNWTWFNHYIFGEPMQELPVDY